MLCPRCGSQNPASERTCLKCGSALGAGATKSMLSSFKDNLKKQLQQELAESMSDGSQPAPSPPSPTAEQPPSQGPSSPPLPPGARALDLNRVDRQELIGLVEALPSQVNQSASFTFASPFIQGNPLYRQRIGNVSFLYVPQDYTLNAFATDHSLQTGGGQQVRPPAIVFYAGLATALRLAAAALAAHIDTPAARSTPGTALADTFQLMGQAVLQSRGTFSPEVSKGIFTRTVLPLMAQADEHVLSLARSYVAAMESFVIAHEAGHLALCHTLGQHLNFDVSRNQEREADSFASSALCTSPFREYLFLGSIFVTIIFTWVDHAAGHSAGTTHPVGRERFFNLLRSNESAAEEAGRRLGLSPEQLAALLPRT